MNRKRIARELLVQYDQLPREQQKIAGAFARALLAKDAAIQELIAKFVELPREEQIKQVDAIGKALLAREAAAQAAEPREPEEGKPLSRGRHRGRQAP